MLLIGGTWRAAQGEPFTSLNPSTGEPCWTGNAASERDVKAAVGAAAEAGIRWRRVSVHERARFLEAFQQQLQEHRETFAELISQEVGKPLWDAHSEVAAMIAKYDVTLAAWKERRAESETPAGDALGRTRYKPHGVMAVFGPFNFPGHIANGQFLPALLAGNTICFKPSELTPRVAEFTVQLWERAGLPKGVMNLLQGGRETGECLVSHPDVNGILFTGSVRVGLALRRQLADSPQKLLALELGGNNPLVVHNVADHSAASYWSIHSAFLTSGQRCTCVRRLIVTGDAEPFLSRFVEDTSRLKIGPPRHTNEPFMGSLIHPQAVERVLQAQEELMAAGGKVLLAAQRRDDLGPAFVSPGIIDVTDCELRTDEEVFGPLLQVHRVSSLPMAVDEANRTQFGLVAGIFTQEREDFEAFYDHVNAGLINWNRPTTGASSRLPFGGVGLSGNHRPAGYFAIDACNIPIGSLESATLSLPDRLAPGVDLS